MNARDLLAQMEWADAEIWRAIHATANAIGILDDRKTVDKCISVGRRVERGQNPHARGLAGPVGADVAKHLPAMYVEADVVHGPRRAEMPIQPAKLDHRVRRDH